MTARLNFPQVAPGVMKAMLSLESYIHGCGLEKPLIELVKLRASQINGCAYCIDMHTKDARAAGETEQRLYLVSAWREAPFYSEREQAALELTEAMTLIAEAPVSDAVYDRARSHFSEEELVNLAFAITTINSWNRLVTTFRSEVGSYTPARTHA